MKDVGNNIITVLKKVIMSFDFLQKIYIKSQIKNRRHILCNDGNDES